MQVLPETNTGYRLTAVTDTDKYSRFIMGMVNFVCIKAEFVGRDTAGKEAGSTVSRVRSSCICAI